MTFQRKATGIIGWKSLFVQLNDGIATGGSADNSDTQDYNINNYESCTAASTIYACTTCFTGRPNNLFSVTLATADTTYFGSAITYCHDNTITDFKSATTTSVLINDGLNGTSRDSSA